VSRANHNHVENFVKLRHTIFAKILHIHFPMQKVEKI
jgi:hypothetical protein